MIDSVKLRKSLKRLQMQLANWHCVEDPPELAPLDPEAIGESAIQRFETCYDSIALFQKISGSAWV